jgi:hypothetical protein
MIEQDTAVRDNICTYSAKRASTKRDTARAPRAHARVRARERAMAEINAVRTVRLIGRQVERAISKGAHEEGVRGTCRSYTRASARVALRVHAVVLGYFRGT